LLERLKRAQPHQRLGSICAPVDPIEQFSAFDSRWRLRGCILSGGLLTRGGCCGRTGDEQRPANGGDRKPQKFATTKGCHQPSPLGRDIKLCIYLSATYSVVDMEPRV